jgi:hypothetical protein
MGICILHNAYMIKNIMYSVEVYIPVLLSCTLEL